MLLQEDESLNRLNRIAIQHALEQLTPESRELIELCFALKQPTDYVGPWPATLVDIGRHIGQKFGDGALSEGAIRKRRTAILEHWRSAHDATHREDVLATLVAGLRPLMGEAEFALYYQLYIGQIRQRAAWLARGDAALQQELVQEALIALARLEYTSIRINEAAYVTRLIRNRMRDVLQLTATGGRERASSTVSLDGME